MKILNLGCGTKTSPKVINIDWSIYLKIKRNRILYQIAKLFLKGARLEKLYKLSDNIIIYDLSRGIPFAENSVDVVYHSHFLEHLDRDVVEIFLNDVRMVLKPNGIQRVVVPDFEIICRDYIKSVDLGDKDQSNMGKHDECVAAIIWQCVMKEAFTTSHQPPFQRFIENIFLGDARKRGITHQWMYDRINLTYLLKKIGFREIRVEKYNTSSIPNWVSYGLDLDDRGNEYLPGSLYVEARK
jgi:hypothetical protein